MVALNQTQETKWLACKMEYEESGGSINLAQLAEKHGVKYHALRKRAQRELWKAKMSQLSQRIEEKILSKAESYLERKYSRVLKYEAMIDASQSQQSTTNEGIPLLDVDQISDYVLAESRLHDISTSCLRISDKHDVTNTVELGDSFISAISKLRSDPSTPVLSSEDVI